jgi:type VI secretion system protein
MHEQTLLERIRDPRPDEARRAEVDFNRLVGSILAHLRHMLNTRQGGAPAQPKYGLPEIGELVHSMPDGLSDFRQAIKNTIETFEPRLKHVRVNVRESEEDMMLLQFEVTAQLAQVRENALLRFQTYIDPAGRIELKD